MVDRVLLVWAALVVQLGAADRQESDNDGSTAYGFADHVDQNQQQQQSNHQTMYTTVQIMRKVQKRSSRAHETTFVEQKRKTVSKNTKPRREREKRNPKEESVLNSFFLSLIEPTTKDIVLIEVGETALSPNAR